MSEKRYLLFHVTQGIIGQNLTDEASKSIMSKLPKEDVIEMEMQGWTPTEILTAKMELILQHSD